MTTTEPGDSRSYRTWVLALLLLHYTLNYLDRQIVAILAVPIKQEFQLSDTQLGLLGGFAFAIFYSTLAIPIALLADRVNRVAIISAALALWSGFTAMCGLATNFVQLFLCRLGVGIGEAGGVAPAYSLIADYFPPFQRGRALSIFHLGVPIGSALGLVVGGVIAARYGWRNAFLAVGVLGALLAPILWYVIREPARGRFDSQVVAKVAHPAPGLLTVLAHLRSKPGFWFLSFGMACGAMLLYGFGFWLPTFLHRSHGLSLQQSSLLLGGLVFVGGIAGSLLGGWLGDRLGSARLGAYAFVPSAAFLLTLPFLIGSLSVTSTTLAISLLLIPQICSMVASSPIGAAIQQAGPASMRATIVASYLFVVNLVGIGLGVLILGSISDQLTQVYGADGLRHALMICGIVLYPLTALLYYVGGRSLERDAEGKP